MPYDHFKCVFKLINNKYEKVKEVLFAACVTCWRKTSACVY